MIGIFGKIASIARKVLPTIAKGIGFVTNKLLPGASTVIKAVSPMLTGTKVGDVINKVGTGIDIAKGIGDNLNRRLQPILK